MTIRMFPTSAAASYANSIGLVTEPTVTQLNNGIQRAYYSGALPVPQQSPVAAVATGGTFAANTYFWKVTAINSAGETTPSNESSVAIVLNGSATLNWSPVQGATGYRVYRGTSSNGESAYQSVAGGNTTTFTDTGAAGTVATPPASNTAQAMFDVPGGLDVAASGDAAALSNQGYVAIAMSGNTISRPPTAGLRAGFLYIDTQLAIVVLWDGANWRNVVSGAIA